MGSQVPRDYVAFLESLPRARAGACAVITDTSGRVLLVQSYRPRPQFVGGVVDIDEGPMECAVREAWEEVRLRPALEGELPLLCVSWLTATGSDAFDQPGVHFYFDFGTYPDDPPLRLQEDELDHALWLDPHQAIDQLGPVAGPWLAAALQARQDGRTRLMVSSRAEQRTELGNLFPPSSKER